MKIIQVFNQYRLRKKLHHQPVHAVLRVWRDTDGRAVSSGNDFPAGVVEKGGAFSSGERQLLAFARTMAMDPKILILDEATANIDSETEEQIQQSLERMRQGRTTLAIAHRLSTIQDADQICHRKF